MPWTSTYISVADVQSQFKSIVFNAVSKLTSTEVETIITESEAYVKGKVNPFYDVTLITAATTPAAFAVLQLICKFIAAGRVQSVLRKNGIEQQESNEANKVEYLYAKGEKMLKGISLFATHGNVDGALALYDATARALGSNGGFTGQGTSEPEIKKDVVQW